MEPGAEAEIADQDQARSDEAEADEMTPDPNAGEDEAEHPDHRLERVDLPVGRMQQDDENLRVRHQDDHRVDDAPVGADMRQPPAPPTEHQADRAGEAERP